MPEVNGAADGGLLAAAGGDPGQLRVRGLGQPGLTHMEATVQWLAEILHAITLIRWVDGYAATHWPRVWQELFLRAGAWTDCRRGQCGGGQGAGAGRGQGEEQSTHDVRLAGLRQVLVERLVSGMYELREVGGPRCTPYMQLALATELEQCEGRDKAALDSLLTRLVQELGVTAGLQGQKLHSRSQAREFQLVILHLLSVLMSHSSRPASLSRHGGEPSSWLSRTTASALAQSGTVVHGLAIVKTILS